jgi:hypothetical protein
LGHKGSATVLDGKGKVGIFQEVIGEDDELSHEGGEGEFFRFATSDETEVERSEDRVVAGGDEGGHVKDRAELRAAAEDVALTAELTAVVVKGSDAGESGGLGIGEGAKFGHERDEGGGGENTDALDFLEAIDLGPQIGRSSDFCLDEGFELRDLFLEEGHGFSNEAKEIFVCEGLGEIVVLSDLGEEMGAVFDQGQQLLLEGIWKGERLGLEGLSKLSDQAGIDPVGLGQTVLGAGKVADLPGVKLDDGPADSVRQAQEESFVSAARFTDQDRLWRERLEPGEDGLLGIGEALGRRRVREVEVELGDIDAEVRLHR